MARMTQRYGHNLGLRIIVTWEPFPENQMTAIALFQSCGGTQPAMISNLLAAVLLMK